MWDIIVVVVVYSFFSVFLSYFYFQPFFPSAKILIRIRVYITIQDYLKHKT